MNERPPTTMVRGSESETPHLRVEMPRDVYKRLARAERQVAAVREVARFLDRYASAADRRDPTGTAGKALRESAQRIRSALETE